MFWVNLCSVNPIATRCLFLNISSVLDAIWVILLQEGKNEAEWIYWCRVRVCRGKADGTRIILKANWISHPTFLRDISISGSRKSQEAQVVVAIVTLTEYPECICVLNLLTTKPIGVHGQHTPWLGALPLSSVRHLTKFPENLQSRDWKHLHLTEGNQKQHQNIH